jgi:transcription initiation factor IIE alpha subunit
LDIDGHNIDFPCPRCGFYNAAFIRQVRLNDVLICRGCKSNIQLSDHMAGIARVRRQLMRVVQELQAAFDRLGR